MKQALVDDTEDVSLDFGSEEELALRKAKIREQGARGGMAASAREVLSAGQPGQGRQRPWHPPWQREQEGCTLRDHTAQKPTKQQQQNPKETPNQTNQTKSTSVFVRAGEVERALTSSKTGCGAECWHCVTHLAEGKQQVICNKTIILAYHRMWNILYLILVAFA